MIINISRLKTARNCAAKWLFNYERNLVPTQKGVPLIRGSSTHKALAVWYQTGDIEKMLIAFEEDYRRHAEEGRFITEELVLVDQRVKEGRTLLTAYAKQFPSEPWELPRAEQTFKVYAGEACLSCGKPHDGLPDVLQTPNELLNQIKCECGKPIHVLIGRLDLLVMFKSQIWIVEHKTHKQVSSVMLRSYGREPQGIGYVYGASKALKLDIKGFILNVLKTTKVPDFEREIFMVSKASQRQFVYDLYKTVEDIDRWKAEGYWPQNPNSCFDWMKACPYLSFCDMYRPLTQLTDEEILQVGFEYRELDYADETFIQEDKRI